MEGQMRYLKEWAEFEGMTVSEMQGVAQLKRRRDYGAAFEEKFDRER